MRIVDIPTDPTPTELIQPKIELHNLVRKTYTLFLQIAEQDPRYDRLIHCPLEMVRRLTEPERLDSSFRVVRWYGRTFHFTAEQAAAIRLLYAAYRAGRPKMRETTLIARLKPEAEEAGQKVRLWHVFRVGKSTHPAMDYMIFNEAGWWWLGKKELPAQ